MPVDNTTCTYSINEPFETALKNVEHALADAGITIAAMLNLAERLRKALMVSSPPCVVLFVFPGKEAAADPCLTAVLPLHIVVAARGAQTEVHFLHGMPRRDERMSWSAALGHVQAGISSAIGRIGMRKLEG